MSRETFNLTSLTYNRGESDVQVSWQNVVSGTDGAVTYPNGSFGGPFVPPDALINALDAFKAHVVEILGVNRDLKSMNEQNTVPKEIHTFIMSNNQAVMNDLTVKKISLKWNEGTPQVLTVTCYWKGPGGIGTSINLSVRVDRDGLGYEEALLQLAEDLETEAYNFVIIRGESQLEVFKN